MINSLIFCISFYVFELYEDERIFHSFHSYYLFIVFWNSNPIQLIAFRIRNCDFLCLYLVNLILRSLNQYRIRMISMLCKAYLSHSEISMFVRTFSVPLYFSFFLNKKNNYLWLFFTFCRMYHCALRSGEESAYLMYYSSWRT